MKLRAKSLRRIKMVPRTRIVKISALLRSQFGLLAALNFQLIWMVTAYKMMELKRNLSLAAYLSARKTYLQRKRRYLQARRVHSFPNSLVLCNLICKKSMFSHSIWALKLERQWIQFSILLSIFHWNRFCFLAAAILFSCFSAGLKFRFDYIRFFSDFLARLPGLKILARFAIFSPGWIPLHVIDNLILRGFVSEAGLKFQPG